MLSIVGRDLKRVTSNEEKLRPRNPNLPPKDRKKQFINRKTPFSVSVTKLDEAKRDARRFGF